MEEVSLIETMGENKSLQTQSSAIQMKKRK
jgi:hypothetical protein